MIEIYKPKKIIRPHIEALHGHTTIELRNVRTGRRERIEHDNTFTDGIENFLLSSGILANSPWTNSAWKSSPAWQRLVGGIFCFDTAIPTSGATLPTFMPAGTKMIANGSYNVSNSGSVTEMGSYNTTESIAQADSLTMVYDWATAQGNGTINSVCLTSDTGGYIGYGNSTSEVSQSTKKAFNENQTSSQLIQSVSGGMGTFSAEKNKYYYWTTNSVASGASLTISMRPLALSEVSLFDVASTKTLTNPGSATMRPLPAPEGKILWFPTSTITAGSTATIYLQDIETGAVTSYSLTAPAGSGISYSSMMTIDGGFVFQASDYYLYTYAAESYTAMASGFEYRYTQRIGADLYVGNGYIYDAVNDTCYPINGYGVNPTNYGSDRVAHQTDAGQIIYSYDYSNNLNIYAYRNPLYLATINNLDEEITKTADSTMKITYNITPAA